MRLLPLALAAALTTFAAPALACTYDGVRGYDRPNGNSCRASYNFTAYSTADGGITFNSDGREWRFALVGVGDDLSYVLDSLSPPTRNGLSALMFPAPGSPVIEGQIDSGFCGTGTIRLTEVPGTCGRADAPPPIDDGAGDPPSDPTWANNQGLPVSGRSYGGIVRAGPGLNFNRVTSLGEGAPITLLRDTGVAMNGYNWFEIQYRGGRTGYQWGGILCADTEITGGFVCR
ncbi:MAG: SH3 domain-containing protein [Pseudomonadota bacterium]